MKVLILLFFVFLTPLFVLLLTFNFSGVSPTVLKNSLSEGKVYPQISNFIAESINTDDIEFKQLSGFITDRFTAEYIQQKTELAIEDSHDWITGESSIAPVVSFSELKDDLLDKNPALLKELESMSAEMKESDLKAETVTVNDEENMDNQIAMEAQMSEAVSSFSSIINQDFSIKLEPYLVGIKGFYSFSKILLPLILVLMIGCLVFLGFLAQNWKSRFKWIGSTLMVSGLIGFCIVFFNNLLITVVTNYLSHSEEKGIINLFLPATVSIFKTILDANNNYQLITSITLFIIAAGLFVGASLNKDHKALIPSTKTSKKKSL